MFCVKILNQNGSKLRAKNISAQIIANIFTQVNKLRYLCRNSEVKYFKCSCKKIFVLKLTVQRKAYLQRVYSAYQDQQNHVTGHHI